MKPREPVFLALDEVLGLHADQITRYGGSLGVRDVGLLESALAMPKATFGKVYLHGTLPEMAAAYLFHICKNHPFIDGNKRAALMVAYVFLGVNGLALQADPGELTDVVLHVADGTMSKGELSVFIERTARPRIDDAGPPAAPGGSPRTGRRGARR